MTGFVKMWVTSSAVQQNVPVLQNAGEERQGAAFQAAAGTRTSWLWLLSLHLTHVPRAEPPLGKGAPEKAASAGARGSEGRWGDLGKKNYSIHTARIPVCYWSRCTTLLLSFPWLGHGALKRTLTHFSWLLCLSFRTSAQCLYCVSLYGFSLNIYFRKHTPTAAECSL